MTDKFVQPVKVKKPAAKKPATKKTKKYTSARILFVLDKSSSMSHIRKETIEGVNAFLEEQKTFKQKAHFTLCQFNQHYSKTHDKCDLTEVEPLTAANFVPSGYTALYDAIGHTITQALADDAASPTGKPPKGQKTVLAILTDGEENSSKEFNNVTIRALIEQVQKENDWEVIFIGANIDAATVGGNLGVMRSKTASFDYSGKGVSDVMKSVSYASNASRGMDYEWMRGVTLGGAAAACADGTIDMNVMYAAVTAGLDEKLKAQTLDQRLAKFKADKADKS